ncbi:MAG: tetratricopeptide repeat protein [Candidatus Eremiobacteraeota bacterium]|nr:tetratricopeptide repeat protein [Candidatus Eremiobacteraeota bacterium]
MEPERLERASKMWKRGYRYQLDGEIDQAIDCYRRSLSIVPTPEAHTFLGSAYGQQGRLEQAKAECLRALAIDPEFGMSYNDLGCYLIKQGRLKEALECLERAKTAQHYFGRHSPYIHTGRIYMSQGLFRKALGEFRAAVGLAPSDPGARKALHSALAWFN